MPILDDWYRWSTYSVDHMSLYWLFRQHADHRLALPKVLFEIDRLFFLGRGWFLLICSFCVQALTGTMLWHLSVRSGPQDRKERLMLAAAITVGIYSAQQWFNFVMPFQVQFPLVYCTSMAALYFLWKAGERDRWGSGPWVLASIIAAAGATFSMANGILLWPVLILAAIWLRISWRGVSALALGGMLTCATFFYHWYSTAAMIALTPAERWSRITIFLFAHLGSPMLPIVMWSQQDNLRLAGAMLPGAILALTLLAAFVMLWLRRNHFTHARAMLVFYCVFLALTSASVAYGRSAGSLFEAFTPRYLTPAYLLWIGMLLAGWPLLRRLPRTGLYAALCAAMFAGVVMHQQDMANTVRHWRLQIRLGELAVVDNVTDTEAWRPMYDRVRDIIHAVDYLRQNRLAIFSEEWTHWPGVSATRRFFIDRNPDACQGQFDEAFLVPSDLRPGWRLNGWAWDVKAARPPRYVILVDDNGQVAGVARTGFPQPASLSILAQEYLSSPWIGYVGGRPRPITAYVLEADNRSLCAIGKHVLPRSGREVDIADVGPLLPESTPEITGDWVKDAYFKGHGGPGDPPAPGVVYGSFPDAGVGTLQLGPFHLDGHTELAIPLVTGPDSQNLSITLRDAATKEVLSKMTAPADACQLVGLAPRHTPGPGALG